MTRGATLALLVVAAVLLAGAPSTAEPVVTIRNNGPTANRVDLAVLGDGYTAAEIASGKYAADVEAAIQGMFGQEPYTEYQRFYNVHRVDVTSIESGADHPEIGVFKNTALDATYNCSGIQRLICVSITKVNNVLTASSLPANARDHVLVIVNDSEYGGSGGTIAVASTHSAVVELVLHELGHSFALLADEYTYQPPSCNNSIEPFAANATRETARASIKWGLWIDPSTPVPTTSTTPGVPGLYQGAQYCPVGLYRPTDDSKMRSLSRPFEQINTEAHVKRVYNLVSPLDSSSPAASSMTLARGQTHTFSAAVPAPWTHSLTIAWAVDGTPTSSAASFLLQTSSLSIGVHTITILVSDGTPMVRNDSGGLLTESRSWTVTVTPPPTETDNDRDGDGKADLAIFRRSTGTWFVSNSSSGYTTNSASQFGLATDLPVAGDYDGDGKMDLAVYRPSNGGWYVLQSGTDTAVVYALGVSTDLPVPADYDGDGKNDPAVYRPSTRAWYILASSLGYGTALTFSWGQRGDVPVMGDYDGDDKADLTVYRPSTGRWFVLTSGSGFTVSREFQWGLGGDVPVPGDYDEDGTTDVAVYRPNTGVWFILQSASNFTSSVSHQWGLSGDVPVPSDYDGDGKTDLAVYRTSNGTWYIAQSTTNYATSVAFQWGLNGDVPAPLSTLAHALAVRSTLATLVRASDVDADRKSDLTVYRPSTGAWHSLRSSTNFTSYASYQWGSTNDIPVPHDYDGDGRTDIAFYRTVTGHWSILQSSTNYTTSVLRQWGAVGDVPVVGDYDGDGQADPAVYRPSGGMWYIVQSSTNFTTSMEFQWGLSGDVPVSGDYDGDSLSDVAVYRPSSGDWFIRYSSTGFATTASYQWGLPGDIAVPGEYDGDGKTDFAVYRPSNGYWFIRHSSTGYATSAAYQWGLSSDVPVPGDFDGDAKTDVAVWRPSNGTWYLLKSSTNFTASAIIQWGLSGDIPILRRP